MARMRLVGSELPEVNELSRFVASKIREEINAHRVGQGGSEVEILFPLPLGLGAVLIVPGHDDEVTQGVI